MESYTILLTLTPSWPKKLYNHAVYICIYVYKWSFSDPYYIFGWLDKNKLASIYIRLPLIHHWSPEKQKRSIFDGPGQTQITGCRGTHMAVYIHLPIDLLGVSDQVHLCERGLRFPMHLTLRTQGGIEQGILSERSHCWRIHIWSQGLTQQAFAFPRIEYLISIFPGVH